MAYGGPPAPNNVLVMPPASPAGQAQTGEMIRARACGNSVNTPKPSTNSPSRIMPASRGRLTSSVTPSTVPTRIIGTRRVHSPRTAFFGFSKPTLSAAARSASTNSASANLSGTRWVASGMVISAAPKPVMPNTSAPRNAIPASAAASSKPGSNSDLGVERVQAGDLGGAEHVAFHRLQDFSRGELALHRALLHVEGEQREHVMVRDRIVPRRARSVVPEIVALHVRVVGEPGGVIVDSLARAARPERPALAL